MGKNLTGERQRVDGERAQHAVNIVIQRGHRIKNHGRLLDETGYQIRTYGGPVINLYDTGSITVSGNNRHLITAVLDEASSMGSFRRLRVFRSGHLDGCSSPSQEAGPPCACPDFRRESARCRSYPTPGGPDCVFRSWPTHGTCYPWAYKHCLQ